MTPEERKEIGSKMAHYWTMLGAIYEMSQKLQQANTIAETLDVCVRFAQQLTTSRGVLARCSVSGRDYRVSSTEVSASLWERLEEANHPFREQVISQGELWWPRPLTAENQREWGLAEVSAVQILAVPIKNRFDTTFGGMLIWRDEQGRRFGEDDVAPLDLCVSQTTLMIESIRAMTASAFATASRAQAYQLIAPITELNLEIAQLTSDVARCQDIECVKKIHKEHAESVQNALDELTARTREFVDEERTTTELRSLVQKYIAQIPHARDRIEFVGDQVEAFVMLGRLGAALQEIVRLVLPCLPPDRRIRVSLHPGESERTAAQIVFSFPQPESNRLTVNGSIFKYGQEDMIQGLLGTAENTLTEESRDVLHFIRISIPAYQAETE